MVGVPVDVVGLPVAVVGPVVEAKEFVAGLAKKTGKVAAGTGGIPAEEEETN